MFINLNKNIRYEFINLRVKFILNKKMKILTTDIKYIVLKYIIYLCFNVEILIYYSIFIL